MPYVIQDKKTGEVLVRNRALGSWWRMPEKCLDKQGRVLKLVYVFNQPRAETTENLLHGDAAPDQDDPERMVYVPFDDVFKGRAVRA